MTNKKRFQVALSFPGEYRPFVSEVANALVGALGSESVFYDAFYEAELGRINLDTYLQHIYREEAELVVIFIGEAYQRKEWCGLEWRAIRDLIKVKADNAILPIRMDAGSVTGLFSIDGYIDRKDRSPEIIAELILDRLRFNRRANPGQALRQDKRRLRRASKPRRFSRASP